MSIKETIKVLSNELACVKRQTGPGCDRNCAACDLVLPDEIVVSAYRTAINILRAKQEAEKNKPLTLDDLRKMAETVQPIYRVSDNRREWALLSLDGWSNEPQVTFDNGEYHLCEGMMEDGYARFYRRPPEGGTA